MAKPITLYPQYLKNVRVKDKKEALNDKKVLEAKQNVENKINNKGRVLLRESGTEPVIRIMIECEDIALCESYANEIADAVILGGHVVE